MSNTNINNVSIGKALIGLALTFALVYATAYVAGKGWKKA
jgi:hypothetical protein